MAFQSLSLTKPGKGSGGFYGDGRVCVWRNWRVAEHGLIKHGPDKITVIEEYPPQCMIGVDLYAERADFDDDQFPEFVTQWYGVGQLPLARLEQLGWPMQRLQQSIMSGPGGQKQWEQRLRNPGGFQPSLDGQSPATEGPFYGSETEDGMYKGSGGWNLLEEIMNLAILSGDAIDDRIAAHGVAAFEGLVARAGTKELPKSKAQQQKEQLTNESKDARKILVPVEVVKWPWQVQQEAPVVNVPTSAAKPKAAAAKPKSGPTAVPAPAPATQPTAAPTPSAPSDGTPSDDDMTLAEAIIKILEKNPAGLQRSPASLGMHIMRAFNGDKKLSTFMQKGNSAEFLGNPAFNGVFWEFDAGANTVKPVASQ